MTGGEAGNGSGDYSPAINITTRGKLLVLHQCDASSLLCDVWTCDTSGPLQHPRASVIRAPHGSVILPVVTRQFLMMPGHCAMINDGQPGPGDTGTRIHHLSHSGLRHECHVTRVE